MTMKEPDKTIKLEGINGPICLEVFPKSRISPNNTKTYQAKHIKKTLFINGTRAMDFYDDLKIQPQKSPFIKEKWENNPSCISQAYRIIYTDRQDSSNLFQTKCALISSNDGSILLKGLSGLWEPWSNIFYTEIDDPKIQILPWRKRFYMVKDGKFVKRNYINISKLSSNAIYFRQDASAPGELISSNGKTLLFTRFCHEYDTSPNIIHYALSKNNNFYGLMRKDGTDMLLSDKAYIAPVTKDIYFVKEFKNQGNPLPPGEGIYYFIPTPDGNHTRKYKAWSPTIIDDTHLHCCSCYNLKSVRNFSDEQFLRTQEIIDTSGPEPVFTCMIDMSVEEQKMWVNKILYARQIQASQAKKIQHPLVPYFLGGQYMDENLPYLRHNLKHYWQRFVMNLRAIKYQNLFYNRGNA